MKLTDEQRGGVLVVRVDETRVDASKAPLFKDEMARRIEAGHTQIVLDLSGVDFIDSSGLGAIVSCLKRLGPRGNMAVAGAKGAVSRLFALTRMDKVFALEETVDGALGRLGA
ncbi:MAG TPA: STAS domain-containing protein [Microvirga sp.]|jgi:anti-sigma B factor antagonist